MAKNYNYPSDILNKDSEIFDFRMLYFNTTLSIHNYDLKEKNMAKKSNYIGIKMFKFKHDLKNEPNFHTFKTKMNFLLQNTPREQIKNITENR